MSDVNFSGILDAAPTEIEYPKLLPQGTYTCVVQGMPRYDKSSKKQTPFVEFAMRPLTAGEDVNEEELAEALSDGNGGVKPLSEINIRHACYLTEASKWRLDEFLVACGFELDGEQSRRKMIEETPGHQLNVYLQHEPSEDGKRVNMRIGTVTPVG